jgi:transposase
VIGPSGNLRVLVATKPVDLRKGAERLAAVVRERMRTDPFSRVVYVFRAKRADRVKLIFWDGSGVVLMAKRLEKGHFHWPAIHDGVMRLSAAQFQALLEGLDWRRVHEPRRTAVPAPTAGRCCRQARAASGMTPWRFISWMQLTPVRLSPGGARPNRVQVTEGMFRVRDDALALRVPAGRHKTRRQGRAPA